MAPGVAHLVRHAVEIGVLVPEGALRPMGVVGGGRRRSRSGGVGGNGGNGHGTSVHRIECPLAKGGGGKGGELKLNLWNHHNYTYWIKICFAELRTAYLRFVALYRWTDKYFSEWGLTGGAPLPAGFLLVGGIAAREMKMILIDQEINSPPFSMPRKIW